MLVASPLWETAFDLIGFAAYYTLMTGQLPGEDVMVAAREGTGPRLLALPREQANTHKQKSRQRVAA